MTDAQRELIIKLGRLECYHRELMQNVVEPVKEAVGLYEEDMFVDLGLPSGLLWAKCNLGAKKETDYGLYFAWGETEGHADASGTKKFSWDDYKLVPQNNLTKYNATDGLTTLQAEDDAVTQMYGEGYRMPTKEEMEELYTNTDHEWTSIDGVSGRKFMKKSDHSVYIFIPASGYCSYGSRGSVGDYCSLWSSSVGSSYRNDAWRLSSYSGYIFMSGNDRWYGQSVRGVGGKNKKMFASKKADKVQNCPQGNFPTLDADGNLQDSGTKPSDYVKRAGKLIFEDDGIYQVKDNSVFPVAHPDLSTQPSVLPQRFGNLEIREVLIAKGRESEIPHDAMVISAFSFNAKECCAAVCRNENGLWKISNSENIVPDFTLVRYVGADTGYYYTSGGEEEPFDETVDDTDDGTLVDLGLPSGLLWAKSNIGANVPSDYGLYFAWGETEGHADASATKKFNWNDYKFGTQNNLTKYNATDGLTTLQAEDDAVTQMYGEGYRMPTREELEELYTNTRHKWITLPNGVSGRKFVSLKDPSKYIFIPASGYCNNGSRNYVGDDCSLWSSSVNSSYRSGAWGLNSYSGGIGMYYDGRCCGQSVRGVGGKN